MSPVLTLIRTLRDRKGTRVWTSTVFQFLQKLPRTLSLVSDTFRLPLGLPFSLGCLGSPLETSKPEENEV